MKRKIDETGEITEAPPFAPDPYTVAKWENVVALLNVAMGECVAAEVEEGKLYGFIAQMNAGMVTEAIQHAYCMAVDSLKQARGETAGPCAPKE